MLALLKAPRTSRRQRLAARLFDEHGAHLSSLAGVLTVTRERSDRLVIDAIDRQARDVAPWRRRGTSLRQLAAGVHGRWIRTHAPRGPRPDESGSVRSRLHDLSDLQVGLLALCLFGGYTYASAGHLLQVTPAEAAHLLREALLLVAA